MDYTTPASQLMEHLREDVAEKITELHDHDISAEELDREIGIFMDTMIRVHFPDLEIVWADDEETDKFNSMLADLYKVVESHEYAPGDLAEYSMKSYGYEVVDSQIIDGQKTRERLETIGILIKLGRSIPISAQRVILMFTEVDDTVWMRTE